MERRAASTSSNACPEGAGAFAAVLGAGRVAALGRGHPGRRRALRRADRAVRLVGRRHRRVADRLHRRLRARPGHPRLRAAARAQHLGGRVLRPRPRAAHHARRARRAGGRRADRAGRRLVPRPPRRLRRPGRLVRRPRRLARRAPPVRRARALPRHAVRAVVRAGDDQPRLRPRPRAPRLDPRPARRASGRPRGGSTCSTSRARTRTTTCWSGSARSSRDYAIDYLKWDHNRDLLEAVGRRDGGDRPSVRAQTLALYRLLDELRERHPGLEIETCSGGGGRDRPRHPRPDRPGLGLGLQRPRRTHPDRALDPGCSSRPSSSARTSARRGSHTTSRTTDLSFRLVASLTAHAGIEQDLHRRRRRELATITAWSGLYREFRPLLHTGRVVNADLADDATALYGVVAQDGSRALFTWTRFDTSAAGQSGRVRLPGLDPTARYRVRVREELGAASRHQGARPGVGGARPWPAGSTCPAHVLATVGVPCRRSTRSRPCSSTSSESTWCD